MKITKFATLAGAALLAGAGAFAQATDDYNLPQGFSFYNEIGSDVVRVTGNAHKDYKDTNWRSEFGGIYDKIGVSYSSEKLEFELAPKFGISDRTENYYDGNLSSDFYGHGTAFSGSRDTAEFTKNADAHGTLNSDDTGFSYWGLDWKLRFTPFDIVNFWLHGGPSITGSNLPARGTEWGAHKLGSDGFAIITSPIDGLKISGAIPFTADFSSKPNWINAEVEDSWITAGSTGPARTNNGYNDGYRFRVDLGAEYTLSSGLVGAGVKVDDVINAGFRQYGVYANVNLGAITANLGYNYSENYTTFLDVFDNGLIKIGGKQAIAGGVTFVAGDLKLAADAMYNMKKSQSVYDMYAGLKAAYDVVPGKFNADILLGVAMDLGTNTHHGTEEDDKDLLFAATTINANFVDLYYAHYALEDVRAAVGDNVTVTPAGKKVNNAVEGQGGLGYVADTTRDYNVGVAANENWQYYTALSRTMANGNIDTTSAAKAALAVRVRPGFTYTTGKNEFQAHVDLTNFFDHDGSYQIKFPVAWKWTF